MGRRGRPSQCRRAARGTTLLSAEERKEGARPSHREWPPPCVCQRVCQAPRAIFACCTKKSACLADTRTARAFLTLLPLRLSICLPLILLLLFPRRQPRLKPRQLRREDRRARLSGGAFQHRAMKPRDGSPPTAPSCRRAARIASSTLTATDISEMPR